jgi:hypothetical protein
MSILDNKYVKATGFIVGVSGVLSVVGAQPIGIALESFGLLPQTTPITSGILSATLGIHSIAGLSLAVGGIATAAIGFSIASKDIREILASLYSDAKEFVLNSSSSEKKGETQRVTINEDNVFRGELKKEETEHFGQEELNSIEYRKGLIDSKDNESLHSEEVGLNPVDTNSSHKVDPLESMIDSSLDDYKQEMLKQDHNEVNHRDSDSSLRL